MGGTQAWPESSRGAGSEKHKSSGRATQGVGSGRSSRTQSSLEGFLEESSTREGGLDYQRGRETLPWMVRDGRPAGRLWSMGVAKSRHDLATEQQEQLGCGIATSRTRTWRPYALMATLLHSSGTKPSLSSGFSLLGALCLLLILPPPIPLCNTSNCHPTSLVGPQGKGQAFS